jgi:hypothetical protein
VAADSEPASDLVTPPACLAALPEGYQILQGERGVLVVRDEYSAPLVEAGFTPDSSPSLPASDVAGRRPLESLMLAGEELLVRHHQHGGLLRFLTGARFLKPGRPFEELILAQRLSDLGIPTPKLVAARSQRSFGPFWRLALVSVRVPGAQDLVRVLAGLDAARAARPLLRAMGELVGRLHRAGLLHVDLHPGNMLVGGDWRTLEHPELWILDLDRCEIMEQLDEDQRLGMLARLVRYGLRRDGLRRVALSRTNVMRFMAGYRSTWDAGDWKGDWRQLAQKLAAGAGKHRLGWRLEELFGAGADSRQG